MKQSWAIRPLGDIISFERGLTYAKGDEVEISSIGVLRSNNVDLTTQSLNLDEIKYIRDDFVVPEKKKVKKFSLLMCMSNGSKDHLGKVALIDQDLDFAFGGFMGLLTPNEADVFPKYLYYALASKSFKDYIHSLADGANINNLKYRDLAEFQILVPSLPEQQRIVDILDQEFAKIDALKANAEKSLQAAKDLFQATLKKELEPKDGWETKTIGDLSLKITDGSHNPPKGIADSEYRMLSSQNVWNGHLDKSVARYLTERDFLIEDRRTCAREGDVLLTIVGTIGRTCVLSKEDKNITFQRSVCIIKPRPELNPYFLCYQLQSKNEEINQQANGAAQKGFYLKQVQRLPIQLTSIQEQVKIVSLLDNLNDRCNTLQDNYQNTLALCDDLKQSLLRKAFNGEL